MEKEKHVDESWKDAVSQEKEIVPGAAGETAIPEDMLEINFLNYATSLALQAMIFLGEIPNPLAEDKVEVNLKQAKFLIDTLLLLRDKTKGNLTKEEDFLNMSLYELQMKFVEKTQPGHQSPSAGPRIIDK